MGEEGEDAKPGLWSLGDGTSGLKEDYTAPLMGRLGDGMPNEKSDHKESGGQATLAPPSPG